jgi:chitin disaccharide deacetylase
VTHVILTADDYAMDEGVDAAILALASRGAVTAAGAMVLSPTWPEAARRLIDVQVDRGLHFDLTSPFAEPGARSPVLPRLMGSAFAGQIDRSAVRHAVERQLDSFEAATRQMPAFVDGHQHVHQLPVVRDVLITSLRSRYGAAVDQIGMRSCLARRWRGLKAAIIAASGARGFSRLVNGGRHPANTDFAGVYGFSPNADLAGLWRGWLGNLAGERPLIMCHVATHDVPGGPPDTIRGARLREWQWLASSAFRDLCTQSAVQLSGWGIPGNANAG